MTTSLYQTSIPAFVKSLTALSAILDKMAADASARNVSPDVLLATRLFPDMFPLSRQIQLATDHSNNAAARLGGGEAPKFSNDEVSFDQLKARLAASIAFQKSVTAAQTEGADDKEFGIRRGGETRPMSGRDYVVHFALPSFYFHVTTAYAILRSCGVPLGKNDYLGPL